LTPRGAKTLTGHLAEKFFQLLQLAERIHDDSAPGEFAIADFVVALRWIF